MNHHRYPTAMLMAAIVILGAGAARADVPRDVQYERIAVSPAELQSDTGLQRVMTRVSAAAKRVCDTGGGVHDFASRTCEREAQETAAREVQAKRAGAFGQTLNTARGH